MSKTTMTLAEAYLAALAHGINPDRVIIDLELVVDIERGVMLINPNVEARQRASDAMLKLLDSIGVKR